MLDLVADEQQCVELEYKGKLIRLEFIGEAPEIPHDPEALRRALKASAGILKDIDIEELKRDLREIGIPGHPESSLALKHALFNRFRLVNRLPPRKVEATALIESLAPDGIYISIISYMEAFQGVLREADSQNSVCRTTLISFRQHQSCHLIVPVAEELAREFERQ